MSTWHRGHRRLLRPDSGHALWGTFFCFFYSNIVFSGRPDLFAVAAIEFAAEGTANVQLKHGLSLSGVFPAPQLCFGLSDALCKPLGAFKTA